MRFIYLILLCIPHFLFSSYTRQEPNSRTPLLPLQVERTNISEKQNERKISQRFQSSVKRFNKESTRKKITLFALSSLEIISCCMLINSGILVRNNELAAASNNIIATSVVQAICIILSTYIYCS